MIDKILPASTALALHGPASSRALETAAQAGLPAHSLMERAGLAVAKLARAIAPLARQVWVLCGPGNNGGDGLVAGRLLAAAGLQVHLTLLNEGKPLPTDAAAALRAAQAAGLEIHTRLADVPASPDLVIDALLGLGLSRAPSAPLAEAIALINRQSCPVLAVDLPSGLQSDSGALAGMEAVRAQHTLALLSLKPGLFTAQGRDHAGELWFDPLGTADKQPADAWLSSSAELRDWQAPGAHSSHKGSQGDLLVIGGAPGMRGAAWLAGSAGLGAGAGRVYVCLLEDSEQAPWPPRPELMRWPEARLASPEHWQDLTLVCGCGGGAAVRGVLPALLTRAARLVLDADALNAIAADPSLQALLRQRAAQGLASILTPHPLEAARLLGCSAAKVQADRLGAAAALGEQLQCTVILKGSGSIVASPGELPAINSSGNAALATPGSGDVLAGWLGGLWARRTQAGPHALARSAAYWHGAAAQGQHGPLRAADLIERMHALHAPNPD
jgi:hydroxyethylthiazole kinase-like uncharacterized protein yjeF